MGERKQEKEGTEARKEGRVREIKWTMNFRKRKSRCCGGESKEERRKQAKNEGNKGRRGEGKERRKGVKGQ